MVAKKNVKHKILCYWPVLYAVHALTFGISTRFPKWLSSLLRKSFLSMPSLVMTAIRQHPPDEPSRLTARVIHCFTSSTVWSWRQMKVLGYLHYFTSLKSPSICWTEKVVLLFSVYLGHILSVVSVKEAVKEGWSRASDGCLLADECTTDWYRVDLSSLHPVPSGNDYPRRQLVPILVADVLEKVGSSVNSRRLAELDLFKRWPKII